jgi:CubicO group peptidase (beta-lactamase class C family)
VGSLGAAGGFCAPDYRQVREEFVRNFTERGELGASLCVIHRGATVVDLWGGHANHARTRTWTKDTLAVVFSATKGALALCAHVLAYQRDLDLDRPVRHYWPAFESTGKRDITTRMCLNHQAGLPGLPQRVTGDAIHDLDRMVDLVAMQEPMWEPGTRHGYHALTFGWLVGEVVRRITGASPGTFFRQWVAAPLGSDFWIGLPPDRDDDVAESVVALRVADALGDDFRRALEAGDSIQVAAMNSYGGFLDPGGCDAPGAHRAEIPAANGITNGRGLARMYAALAGGGTFDGVRLVDEDQVLEMGAVESAAARDAVELEASRFSPGFQKASYARVATLGAPGLVFSESAFGHAGMGGSVGFADPAADLAFGYVMNRHPVADERVDARYQPLIDAVYRALGFESRRAGKWR